MQLAMAPAVHASPGALPAAMFSPIEGEAAMPLDRSQQVPLDDRGAFRAPPPPGQALFAPNRVNFDPAARQTDFDLDDQIRLAERTRIAEATEKWLNTPIRYKAPAYSRDDLPRSGDAQRYVGGKYDQSQLHLCDFSDATPAVNVYRVEVKAFNKGYGHITLKPNETGARVELYIPHYAPRAAANPPPFAKDAHGTILRDATGQPVRVGAERAPAPPSNDPAFPDWYVEQHRADKGNKSWLNMGNPQRALQFFDKSNTPWELALGRARAIKTFQVEPMAAQKVMRDAIHESLGARHRDKPINVDRAEPNQFGLPPSYAKLLEEKQLPGTAKELTRGALAEQIGTPYWTPAGTPYTTAGPTRMNSLNWWRDTGLPFGPPLDTLRQSPSRVFSHVDSRSANPTPLSPEPQVVSLPAETRRPDVD